MLSAQIKAVALSDSAVGERASLVQVGFNKGGAEPCLWFALSDPDRTVAFALEDIRRVIRLADEDMVDGFWE